MSSTPPQPARMCVVCKRTNPKTIFSCRYKVHDKNVNVLQDYFNKQLDFGELCDRCYRMWYKTKRQQNRLEQKIKMEAGLLQQETAHKNTKKRKSTAIQQPLVHYEHQQQDATMYPHTYHPSAQPLQQTAPKQKQKQYTIITEEIFTSSEDDKHQRPHTGICGSATTGLHSQASLPVLNPTHPQPHPHSHPQHNNNINKEKEASDTSSSDDYWFCDYDAFQQRSILDTDFAGIIKRGDNDKKKRKSKRKGVAVKAPPKVSSVSEWLHSRWSNTRIYSLLHSKRNAASNSDNSNSNSIASTPETHSAGAALALTHSSTATMGSPIYMHNNFYDVYGTATATPFEAMQVTYETSCATKPEGATTDMDCT